MYRWCTIISNRFRYGCLQTGYIWNERIIYSPSSQYKMVRVWQNNNLKNLPFTIKEMEYPQYSMVYTKYIMLQGRHCQSSLPWRWAISLLRLRFFSLRKIPCALFTTIPALSSAQFFLVHYPSWPYHWENIHILRFFIE